MRLIRFLAEGVGGQTNDLTSNNYEINRYSKTTPHEGDQVLGSVYRHGHCHGAGTNVLQCYPDYHHRKQVPHPGRHGRDHPVEDHRVV